MSRFDEVLKNFNIKYLKKTNSSIVSFLCVWNNLHCSQSKKSCCEWVYHCSLYRNQLLPIYVGLKYFAFNNYLIVFWFLLHELDQLCNKQQRNEIMCCIFIFFVIHRHKIRKSLSKGQCAWLSLFKPQNSKLWIEL